MSMKIDISTAVGAVIREVRDLERDGQPAKAIVASRTYETDLGDLWDAVTNPERIPRWLMPITGDLRVGGRYQLEGNAGGEILRCDPPRLLEVTWEFGGGTTWLKVDLTEEGSTSATLRLEHVALVDPHWGEFGPGAVGIGWDLSLLGLAEHLRTGEAVALEGAEWASTPEAVDFMRRSSDGWAEADVAAGTPAEVAHAAAARTIAAYTGA